MAHRSLRASRRARFGLAGSLIFVAAPPVIAQAIEEVVVTAQRRAESVQEVPVAVSAFSREELERIGATEALDIAKVVPNFVAHNNTGLGTANTYSLRGLNNTESIATFDPPVGTYVDDFFIQRQNANNYALFDVNRVEVLRGPQGTLFGRNTTGGAVRVILNEPSDEVGGFFEVGVGRFDRYTARASFDGPVSDNFRTKASAYYIQDDGFVDNLTTGQDGLNSEDNKGLRFQFQWDIGEAAMWDFAVTFADNEHANMFNFADSDGDRFTRTGLVEDASPLANLLVNDKRNFGLGNATKSTHVTSDFEVESGIGTFNFLTGFITLEQDFVLDFFEGPFQSGGFTIANEGEHDQITQEIKLTGATDVFNYTAGFFYFREENETDFAQIFNLGAIGLFLPGGFPLVQYDRILANDTDSWAVYTQFDWNLTNRLTLTTGVRFTSEEKEIELIDNGNPLAGATFESAELLAAGVPLEQDESIVTPRVALEWQANDDFMIYASATRGFKSGGWNARGTTAPSLQPFSEEKVWSYEAGLRSEFAGNRARFNATVFFSDVEDFQLPSAFNDPVTGSPTFITRNFADLEVQGVELEFLALPFDNLTVFINLGLLDAEYKNLDPSIVAQQQTCRTTGMQCAQGIVNPNGDIAPPVRSPDYQASVGGWYEIPLSENMRLVPKVSVIQYGDHNISTSGQDVALVDAYTVVNGGISLQHEEQDWRLTAECKNCGDREQKAAFLAGFIYLNDPMTWSLNFNKGF